MIFRHRRRLYVEEVRRRSWRGRIGSQQIRDKASRGFDVEKVVRRVRLPQNRNINVGKLIDDYALMKSDDIITNRTTETAPNMKVRTISNLRRATLAFTLIKLPVDYKFGRDTNNSQPSL